MENSARHARHHPVSAELTARHATVSDELTARHHRVSDELTARHHRVSDELTARHHRVSAELTARHHRVSAELTARWPEHRVAPSLGRIAALCELLGDPQQSAPVIQITGTNGKGSTAIMIDALLRSTGLRTGRFASPHLSDITERICIDGEPIEAQRFDELWDELAPLVAMVDGREIDGVPMTFFEVITGMAYAAFADAPVDVMIIEVGMGGTWDATSVASPQVSVICPIGLDHTHILGDTVEAIATEKAGIIKPGSVAVIADQTPEAERVLVARCLQAGVPIVQEGRDFALLDRAPAVGGQVIRIESAGGPVGSLFLPLFGAHMARNAALAVAAVEALLGAALDPGRIEAGLAAVIAPARLEVLHRDPAVVLDTAHNPQGVQATLTAVAESFDFHPLIAVIAMMADKDVETVLDLVEASADAIVCTTMDTPRALPLAELTELAQDKAGEQRVHSAPRAEDALLLAADLAVEAGPGAGVLVLGSVQLAGEVRDLLISGLLPEDED